MKKSEFYVNARNDLKGPLHGVTVVENTTTWAGPMAGCVLADFGADVIKVEHPDGEVSRRVPPFVSDSGHSLANETVNRNKQSVSLDLRHPEGKRAFLRLVASADIIIENFRPGTLHGWGVGYQDVAAVKPDIVYVSISGFGQFGPESDRVGYDPLAQNFSGWASLNGEPQGGPMKAPTYLGDDLAGLHGALGAMAALRHRDQTGEGQHVDVALVDSLLYQCNGALSAAALNLPLQRMGNQFAFAVPANNYACRNGHVFFGALLESHWKLLAHHLGRDDLADVDLLQRIQRRDELDELVRDYCAGLSTAEVIDAFNDLGLPGTRVNTFAEAAKEPHILERDMLQPTTLTDGTTIPLTGPAAKFSRTPTRVHTPAQPLGAQNEAVLATLGYTADEIEQLKEVGAT
ncbi:MAG: CoA transferase [Pseudomonadales bacterium]|nr:CoA transferase [Pseudomonadales bacterium]MDP6469725.1 CoA transferase [Pseudomonadales bacterium]MDP6827674.1 CoA transferase [Pseudomonadales bacterium]MDP6971886.1 CoA transferase [Pseudomonadales bacterium]